MLPVWRPQSKDTYLVFNFYVRDVEHHSEYHPGPTSSLFTTYMVMVSIITQIHPGSIFYSPAPEAVYMYIISHFGDYMYMQIDTIILVWLLYYIISWTVFINIVRSTDVQLYAAIFCQIFHTIHQPFTLK